MLVDEMLFCVLIVCLSCCGEMLRCVSCVLLILMKICWLGLLK